MVHPSPARSVRIGLRLTWILAVLVVLTLPSAVPLASAGPTGLAGYHASPTSPLLVPRAPSATAARSSHLASLAGAAPLNTPNGTLQCDGMLWSSTIWASYDPSYCYGHDEPTLSYVSTAAGSGEDAHFRVTLPADGATYGQGDFYATIWFGGTVYDTQSTGGGNQAFLEFQFYPAAPAVTGPNSGASDCLPDGAFNPVWTLGSNTWFACAIVWQIQGTVENAAFAGPLDAAGSSAILVMNSNNVLDVNYSGVAQSSTQGWTISVADTTTGGHGSVTLVNGSLVLSPYYSTAARANTLKWGASNPGAIAFAYEVGHALDPSTPASCVPGDNLCDSYWPGRWAQAGQLDLELPVVGASGSATYPSQLIFSSSQGGENEVNSSSCGAPSSSTLTNCMYPFFQYRGGFYGFTFGTTAEPNATYLYGGEYQFPATTNSHGQWNGNSETAPWGTLSTQVSPLNATVEFNRKGETDRLSVAANGTAGGQFEEGPYWLNISAPGCTSSSTFVYVRTGAVDSPPGSLSCGGAPPLSASAAGAPTSGVAPLSVVFTGSATGGTSPYGYNWSFGDGGTSTVQDPQHTFTAAGQYTVTLLVRDASGVTASASVTVSVSGPVSAHASATPASGGIPLTVLFSGSAAGGTPPYAYVWYFGDGGSSSLQNPDHTYTAVGNYTARLTVTDSIGNSASFSLSVTATPAPAYSVYFNETGLPTGTAWNVSMAGVVRVATSGTIGFSERNGTYAYRIGVSDSRYRASMPRGNLPVAGPGAAVVVVFERSNYTVAFTETSLPASLSWSVAFGGLNRSSSLGSISFSVANGSYNYSITGPSGYGWLPRSGTVAVAGTNLSFPVSFSAVLYQVAFEAQGLASGTNWTVSLNGVARSSASGFVNFSVVIGTYGFVLTPLSGYRATPSNGSVTVNGTNRSLLIVFSPILYPVTFVESGLPNGTAWNLTLDATPFRTVGPELIVPLANGSHSYAVAAVPGYLGTNGSGTVLVVGRPVLVRIGFAPATSARSILSELFSSKEFYLGLIAVGLMVVGAVIYAVGARRRRREPPLHSPAAPPAAPPAP